LRPAASNAFSAAAAFGRRLVGGLFVGVLMAAATLPRSGVTVENGYVLTGKSGHLTCSITLVWPSPGPVVTSGGAGRFLFVLPAHLQVHHLK